MNAVTIRRCPICQSIVGHTDQLVTELRKAGVQVKVVNGNKGEFSVDAAGHPVTTRNGEWLRDVSDLAAEIRGVSAAAV